MGRPLVGRLGKPISNTVMSQHRSLRAAATLGAKRNVLKRFERVEILKKRGEWKDGARVTGLRKTKPAP
jgi:small basic protein (TIGR04137 family)